MLTMKTSYISHILLLEFKLFHVIRACKGTSLNTQFQGGEGKNRKIRKILMQIKTRGNETEILLATKVCWCFVLSTTVFTMRTASCQKIFFSNVPMMLSPSTDCSFLTPQKKVFHSKVDKSH